MFNSPNGNSQFNQALLQHICQLNALGDKRAIARLGVSIENLANLESLNVTELALGAQINLEIASIKIDNSVLSNLLSRAREESTRNKKLSRLLQLGASFPLVKDLTGMNGSEFSKLRRSLGFSSTGRSHVAKEQELDTIYKAWRKLDLKTNLSIDDWIYLGESTKIKLSTIHPVVIGNNSPSEPSRKQSEVALKRSSLVSA